MGKLSNGFIYACFKSSFVKIFNLKKTFKIVLQKFLLLNTMST